MGWRHRKERDLLVSGEVLKSSVALCSPGLNAVLVIKPSSIILLLWLVCVLTDL